MGGKEVGQAKDNFLESHVAGRRPPSKPLLVFVNPIAGDGYANVVHHTVVLPMCSQYGVSVDTICTESWEHVHDIGRNHDLGQLCGVVCVSGDGSLFEFINGMAERPEPLDELLRETPVGAVPAGTSNGLAVSLRLQEPRQAMRQILCALLRPEAPRQKLDLYTVSRSGRTIWDFHATCWGFLADIDLDAERSLRWMPVALRGVYCPVKHILRGARYKCKMSHDGEVRMCTRGNSKGGLPVWGLMEEGLPGNV